MATILQLSVSVYWAENAIDWETNVKVTECEDRNEPNVDHRGLKRLRLKTLQIHGSFAKTGSGLLGFGFIDSLLLATLPQTINISPQFYFSYPDPGHTAVARTLIGGVSIHIFMFCPTSFF